MRMSRPDTKNGRTPRAGARERARLLLLALLLLASPAAAREVQVEVETHSHGCRVQGGFHTEVTPEVAWAVVSDYENIPRFVRSMVASRLETDSTGTRRVHQTATGGLFVFQRKVHVVLALEEDPGRRIRFRDVSGRDFRRYDGEWRIDLDSLGTRVSYELDAEPRSAMPGSLVRGAFRGAAADLLDEVRREMTRRATPTDPTADPSGR
ncbi:MAG: hypothetical protein RL721_2400 [Candidatus Eisenbacteria bacterium]|jgi:ribosome-associated toxin RatA of RatAB toxin-antitoxin module